MDFTKLHFGLAGVAVITTTGGLYTEVQAQDPPPVVNTPISELILYGIDDDTHNLIRYEFAKSDYTVIAPVHLSNDTVLTEIESLAYIPGGAYLYGVWNYDSDKKSKLVKINMFTAEATLYDQDTGYGNVEGMVTYNLAGEDYDRGHGNDCDGFDEDNPGDGDGVNDHGMGHGAHSGCWRLYAVNSQSTGSHDENLISIDPNTGRAETVMYLSRKYEGLAAGLNQTLYATHDAELWQLDPVAGTETKLGDSIFQNIEALESAFGDETPYIEIAGYDAELTAEGALFGFTDNDNTLMIFDKETGEGIPYECAISTLDIEGLVFITYRYDPPYNLATIAFD